MIIRVLVNRMVDTELGTVHRWRYARGERWDFPSALRPLRSPR